jgi:hypothetical protein
MDTEKGNFACILVLGVVLSWKLLEKKRSCIQ